MREKWVDYEVLRKQKGPGLKADLRKFCAFTIHPFKNIFEHRILNNKKKSDFL